MNKLAILLTATTVVVLAGFFWGLEDSPALDTATDAFEEFNLKFKKTYVSMSDRALRLEVFRANYALIAAHNRNPSATYTLEVNKFADLSFEEFEAYYLAEMSGASPSGQRCQPPAAPLVARPDKVDWWSRNMVSPAKNQGSCGSCYAFSAIGAMESALAIASGSSNLRTLSEQELVDCSCSYGNKGCRGGLMNNAFDYILDNKVNLAQDYPYTERQGNCKTPQIGKGDFGISGCVRAGPSVDGLADALSVNPVSVAFYVQNDFRFYKQGVYNPDFCLGQVNHGVLAVGFDGNVNRDGGPFFLVKNSWGGDWGENGFFRIAMGTGRGTCSIAGNGYNYYPTA